MYHKIDSSFQTTNKAVYKRKKRNSHFDSPIKNNIDFYSDNFELKKFGTNQNNKINSDLYNSEITINVYKQKKKQKRKSLKYIEKNIKNKILDISIQIEKEENIESDLNKSNNLNISAIIKKKIDGDISPTPRNRTLNSIKSKNKDNKFIKKDLNESNSKLNLKQKSEIQIILPHFQN